MLAAQSPPGTAESQTRYHGTDQETHQIHIQVGTDTIARIRQPDTLGLVHLKQLLNTHDEMPVHLRGCINLEGEECDLQGDSVRPSDEATAKDPYALDWYFSATCKAHTSPTKAAKFKVGGPHKNNGPLPEN
ncbi:hypothetical protein BGZ72_006192 [Mortierella alpina]|nr:hypothetical protein BGZ72_006192 [Mortierella alpina]